MLWFVAMPKPPVMALLGVCICILWFLMPTDLLSKSTPNVFWSYLLLFRDTSSNLLFLLLPLCLSSSETMISRSCSSSFVMRSLAAIYCWIKFSALNVADMEAIVCLSGVSSPSSSSSHVT